jgi:ParB family chromosome partitioning protein
MTETQSIPLNKLILWTGNVRKTGTSEAIDELASSIEAHGLLQALIVRKAKGGKFAVVAGQRRLKALQLLASQKRIAPDAPVRCELVAAEADAGELSLAENVVRVAMHPADQFEAFRDLVDRGLDVATVARRFGVTESVVLKRLKLGRLSPVVLDAYRDGDIDLEEAQAFAITEDHAAQERVLGDLPGWNRSARSIRNALTEDEIPASDRRVRFVGLDIYEQSGGGVRRDLFDDAHSGTILDPVLLDRLVTEKLATVVDEVRAEGWAWVELADAFEDVNAECRRVRPERIALSGEQQAELEALSAEYDELADSPEADEGDETVLARLDAIQDRLDELDAAQECWTPELLASAGAIISIDWNGTATVERGFIRRDASRQTENLEDHKPARDPAVLPATLVTELTARKTAALQSVAGENVPVMVAAVVHALALSAFYTGAGDLSCLRLSLSESRPERHLPDPEPMPVVQAFADAETRWTELLPEDPSDLWSWCLSQSQETLLGLLAHIGARAMDAVRQKGDRPEAGRFAHADMVADAVGFDMTEHYTPDVPTYFSRVNSTQIIAALCEAKGVTPAPAWARMKKVELAALAARELADTGWLPAILRCQNEVEPSVDAA